MEPAATDPWQQVETLLTEGQFDAAADAAARVREEARKAGDEALWTRALVQEAQLRVSTSGHAEGYRVLRQAEWPRNARDRAILHLYVAATLRAYSRDFSWRIHQRERIDKPQDEAMLDLERATRGEIYAALLAELEAAWNAREGLSDVPLSQVYSYVIPGDYPPEVRGTLRGAVSCRLAEALADSAFWSVEETQDLPRADLPRLIDGTIAASPADAAHPLARMAAALSDLEAWHSTQGERAGALEARRQRLRFLWTHFQTEDARQLLRRDLEEHLPAFRDVSWWAMGMATLADFLRQEGDLPRAQKIAREAAAAFPGTPGGARSLSVAEEIETPHFQLTATASDGFDRRSLRVQHKNLSGLRFRAYPVDLAARLRTMNPWSHTIFPGHREVVASGKPVAEWISDLPPTPDFALHQTCVTPPIHRPGAYLVVATPVIPEPKEKDKAESLVGAVGILLGDLVVSSQAGPESSVITALSGSTGEPLPGVEIQAYSPQSRQEKSGFVPRVKGGHRTGRPGPHRALRGWWESLRAGAARRRRLLHLGGRFLSGARWRRGADPLLHRPLDLSAPADRVLEGPRLFPARRRRSDGSSGAAPSPWPTSPSSRSRSPPGRRSGTRRTSSRRRHLPLRYLPLRHLPLRHLLRPRLPNPRRRTRPSCAATSGRPPSGSRACSPARTAPPRSSSPPLIR